MLDGDSAKAQLDELKARLSVLEAEHSAVKSERDEYKKVYVALLEAYRKLEAGLVGQKRERFASAAGKEQLTLQMLSMLVGHTPEAAAPTTQTVAEHERRKPSGRKPLPENLPRIEVQVLPPEVERLGLDAFERIGEESSETVERRPASVVVVRTVRPKFVAKEKSSEGPAVLQAAAPELPIPRSIAGPSLLADTIVRRFQDHLPLHRLERMYGREGLPLNRSTICGWHFQVCELVQRLVRAMWEDALTSAYLCMDATGVLVQAKEKCRTGHFFVVIAPQKHALFGYTPKHNGAAVDALLGDYKGYLVADAHSVYEHLYQTGEVVEVACWAHSRRYFWKALETDKVRANQALALIQRLFLLERAYATAPPEEKLRRRQEEAKPIVEAFFRFCDDEALRVIDQTPIAKAIGYARNQRVALHRFLEDARLPIHNNSSENALRREALGRRNWLFVGNDEGGEVNATLVTLLASCQMHGIEPFGYLRDLLCLLPSWSVQRVLELAPAYWAQTRERDDVQAALEANIFRRASLTETTKPVAPSASTGR